MVEVPADPPCHRWGAYGTTLVDSLDTLWIMGMEQEFKEARDWVAQSLDYSKADEKVPKVSVFETTIRSLGGLLGAYSLSQDRVFLTKAQDLGKRLLPAFATPSGLPTSDINLATGEATIPQFRLLGSAQHAVPLSEAGTLQLEMRYLSQASGDPSFARAADKALDVILSRGEHTQQAVPSMPVPQQLTCVPCR